MPEADAQVSTYAEFALGAVPQVEAFWSVEAGAKPYRVLPDGCIDFIFDLDRARARVVGTMTSDIVVQLPAGARLFGVRFAPGAVVPFIAARANELTDTEVQLTDLTRAAHEHLIERVVAARDHAQRAREVARFVHDSRSRLQPADLRVRAAIGLLRERHCRCSIEAVAEQLGLSSRQLERLFHEHVGVSPKFTARVVRMQAALRLLEAGPRYRGAPALAAGYADEPHLVREFRALTSLSPRQLVHERRVGFVQCSEPERV